MIIIWPHQKHEYSDNLFPFLSLPGRRFLRTLAQAAQSARTLSNFAKLSMYITCYAQVFLYYAMLISSSLPHRPETKPGSENTNLARVCVMI